MFLLFSGEWLFFLFISTSTSTGGNAKIRLKIVNTAKSQDGKLDRKVAIHQRQVKTSTPPQYL